MAEQQQVGPSPAILACRVWAAAEGIPDDDWKSRAGFVAGYEDAAAPALLAAAEGVLPILEALSLSKTESRERDDLAAAIAAAHGEEGAG